MKLQLEDELIVGDLAVTVHISMLHQHRRQLRRILHTAGGHVLRHLGDGDRPVPVRVESAKRRLEARALELVGLLRDPVVQVYCADSAEHADPYTSLYTHNTWSNTRLSVG